MFSLQRRLSKGASGSCVDRSAAAWLAEDVVLRSIATVDLRLSAVNLEIDGLSEVAVFLTRNVREGWDCQDSGTESDHKC